tara:strand:- start:837 stop:1211 length:375 start_codon:yes stop_codon:yes gene_type:complete
MRINTSIINGMAVYYSHLIRPHPKPMCNIPNIIINNPDVFENPELCISCNCKFACRYNLPPGEDTPQYALVPQTIPNSEFIGSQFDEDTYEKVAAHELMVYDDDEKLLAIKEYPKTQYNSKFEF